MRGERIDLNRIAQLLDLPLWESVEEHNVEYVSEAWSEARKQALGEGATESEAEEAGSAAEQEAGTDLFRNWRGAVLAAAEELFGEHGLRLEPVGDPRRSFDFRLLPEHSWEDAADRIAQTITGIGMFSFASGRELMESGPWTARQAVLGHLHWIRQRPEVYGTASAGRIYERAWR
jgi:hypothetical protein